MQFIKLKGVNANRFRKNGTKNITPLFVKKAHKYGQPQEETAVSKRKNIVITGEHDSGKTKALLKLYSEAPDIWGGQKTKGCLYIDGLQLIGEWFEAEDLKAWHATRSSIEWPKIKSYEKAKLLSEFCKRKKVILFIDNANKLKGRKLDIAKQCILSAKITVMTTQSENQLSPSIRQIILRSDPQFLRLNTEVAYDATNVLIWGLIASCVAAGMWEVAFILGGMKVLGTGRGASKQI